MVNSLINTFISFVQIKLSTNLHTKLTVNFTIKLIVINSVKTSVHQRLSSTAILDNAKK
jgi:hypothetical protein